jgi:hypothetical protein
VRNSLQISQSAETLERESGFQAASPSATDFQAAIYGGRWSEAIQLLEEIGLVNLPNIPSFDPVHYADMPSGKTENKALASGTGTSLERAKFLIAQQKYLEYLESGQQKRALAVLRTELAQLTKDQSVLHSVSG